ncbi:hypothetical protein [Paramagnetospirillum kuznetsovii]|uniref:hypothetical protein n=1 Tax=Paramagnetospirillum kuznetsovii TaxID=2053833 RepID=UPI0011BEB4B0|nr:hypothetical protein [Paramagnetospirillum kuznetsovii]
MLRQVVIILDLSVLGWAFRHILYATLHLTQLALNLIADLAEVANLTMYLIDAISIQAFPAWKYPDIPWRWNRADNLGIDRPSVALFGIWHDRTLSCLSSFPTY